jgi:hypothetical protein
MIQISRHAERRMKLYHITKKDITFVIDQGKRDILPDGKLSIVHDVGKKFKYPIKVVGIQQRDSFLLVTTYPLKKRKTQHEDHL